MQSKRKLLLEHRLNELPVGPGCYLMKDKDERVLYVGKSKSLRKRVKSYFRSSQSISPRIALMIRQVYDIEVIVTDTETEALVLESNLIKNNLPHFNILLKDDKKYPYLCITWSEDYPRLFITRRRRNRNSLDRFYGPYVDVALLRQTLLLVKRLFPLRQRPRPLYKNRTCLNFSIGRCPGVCQQIISSDEYHKILRRVAMIFQGRSQELNKILTKQMEKYSENHEFESAGLVRDQIRGLERLHQDQKVSIPDSLISRDAIALASDGNLASVQIFQIRSGKLVGRLGFSADSSGRTNGDVLESVIEHHYSQLDSVEIPQEILVQEKLPKNEVIQDWLNELRGRKVSLFSPKKHKKADFINLVARNASLELSRSQKLKEQYSLALEDLAQLLELSALPRRIEAYDISHIQGSDAVASQVVFIDGLPAKQHYRKYKIKSKSISPGHSDDFMAMAEIMRRRFRKWSLALSEGIKIDDLKRNNNDPLINHNLNDWPDLVVIDGGKGQLSSAMGALRELNLQEDINICSLAKRYEEVYVPGISSPLESEKDQIGLILLRRLRDEAHRFAVNYHRQQRGERMKRSRLSDIPGLGPKRIKEILSHFKSIEAIQFATLEQLVEAPSLGPALAKDIWNYFHPEELL